MEMVTIKLIENWLANQLLDKSIATMLDSEINNKLDTIINITNAHNNVINAKLDLLLNAPYNKALMRLKEGDILGAKDNLESAIANNKLNLPARLLHYQILLKENKIELALEYAKEAIEMFGCHFNIFPKTLLDQIYKINYLNNSQFNVTIYNSGKPVKALICPKGTLCQINNAFWTIFGAVKYSIYQDTQNIVPAQSGDIQIIHATSQFYIIKYLDKYCVYEWANNLLVSTLNYNDYMTFFHNISSNSSEKLEGLFYKIYTPGNYDDGVNFQSGYYETTETTTETVPETSEYGTSAWIEETHETTTRTDYIQIIKSCK